MKAIVYHSYGSPEVLKYEEMERPTPGDDEVLIKVRAASVNPADQHMMRGVPYFARRRLKTHKPSATRPGRTGRDVAGEVESVGKKVTQFRPGEAVFGCCFGACAEYVCASKSTLVTKPENVTFEQAAATPLAALTALQGLRDRGQILPGQKVLINGAAGGVGTFAVQIGKAFGADVTGVCSTTNVDLVLSIGADRAIDYSREDFTKGAQLYDLIFDLVANHSLLAYRRVLNPGGIYIGAGVLGLGGSMIRILAHLGTMLVIPRISSQKFVTLMAKINKEDLATMRDLMEAGKVKPVIDRRYRLSEVPGAVRYLAEGHARGKVVINLADETE